MLNIIYSALFARKGVLKLMVIGPGFETLPHRCFDVIHSRLKRERSKSDVWDISEEKYPIFVTWKKRDELGGGYKLRGCIGTFTPVELSTGTTQFALNSAFNDHRFPKISERELPLLHCTVSLLVYFERADHIEDWDIHTNGIEINFSVDGEKYSATYLPGVAHEQGWTKKEAVHNLIIKSSYKGPITKQLESVIKITRYQALKFQCTYEEYQKFRSNPK